MPDDISNALGGSNNAPSLLVLIDEALEAADGAMLDQIMDRVVDKLAGDTADRAQKRAELLFFSSLWESGGEVRGQTVPPRPEVENEDQAGKATDLAKKLKDAAKAEESARKGAKDRFLNGGRRIDATFQGRAAPLTDAAEKLIGRLNRWQTKQAEARRKAEAEARKAAEAAEAERIKLEQQTNADDETAAKLERMRAEEERARATARFASEQAAGKTQTRGAGGAMATTRKTYSVKVVNRTLVPQEFLVVDLDRALIEMRPNADGSPGRLVSGLELVVSETTVVR